MIPMWCDARPLRQIAVNKPITDYRLSHYSLVEASTIHYEQHIKIALNIALLQKSHELIMN